MTAILLWVFTALALGQQAAPASVEGIVVKQGTNVPISGVTVELRKLAANGPSDLKRYGEASSQRGGWWFNFK